MADEHTQPPGLIASLVAAIGHLAGWVGLYFAAAYASAALLLGRTVQLDPLAAAFCAGVGLYILDRLKLRDALLDPADLATHEQRHRFLRARARPLRILAWGMLAIGTVLVVAIHPANALLPPVGVLGVLAYSRPHKQRRRPKDYFLLKNLMPGGAIGGLGVILAVQSPVRGSSLHDSPTGTWALPFIGAVLVALVLLIAADAMLCDLDDIAADRASRTSTVPVRGGIKATWRLGLLVHAIAGVLAVTVGWRHGLAVAAAAWACTNLGLTVLLSMARPGQVRDLIDLRLPAATLLAIVLNQML